MKTLLIFLLLLLGSYNIQGQEIIKEKMLAPFFRYYDSGQLQQSGYVSVLNVYDTLTCVSRLVSVVDSTWLLYDSKGKLVQTCQYQNGLKVGVWEYFMDDYIGQAVYVEGLKVRYIEMTYTGKLLFLKDF